MVFQVPPSTPGTKSTPADREEEEEAEEPVIKPAPRFAKFERNNFKCTRCLKVCYAMPCYAGPCCVNLWHHIVILRYAMQRLLLEGLGVMKAL